MKFALIGFGIVVIVLLLLLSVYTVPAGFVGVGTVWGAAAWTAQPGLGLKVPIADGMTRMDVRTQKDQTDVSAASHDLQTVTSTIAVNYHLDGRYAMEVYSTVGVNYQDVLIAPAIQNIFKATASEYTAEQLITNREAVRAAAETALRSQLASYHVIVDNFNIVNFDFSQQFDQAIEAKQVAEQSVETSQQLLDKAKVDAQTVLAQAQGQAEAQKALKDTGALSPEYLQYLALQKWNGILPYVTGGAIPFIDTSNLASQAAASQPAVVPPVQPTAPPTPVSPTSTAQ
jgi:regulator of protease activity HflC (stomatin/prohibitin superfamily)